VTAVLACGVDGVGRRAPQDFAAQRARMVEQQLRARDIRSAPVLNAMLDVPRHLFVPEHLRDRAYDDSPLPIGHGQTISQPFIVAFMTEALDVTAGDRVLEIGTGSGYQAAVLSKLAKDVYTIEILPPWAERARETLEAAGYRLRNPRAAFVAGRAPLPGQEVPGLGLARDMGQLLGRMADRLGLEQVVFRPAYLHTAYAGRTHFRFLDEERQERFVRLLHDLRGHPLAAITRALAEGRVRLDGAPYAWEADLMAYRPGAPPPSLAVADGRARFTIV
jgi:hypothetical protein